MADLTTEKLYQKDVYARACEASVLACPGDSKVILDRTVFFPEGGGQSSDVGTLTLADGTVCDVIRAYDDGDAVVHELAAPAPGLAAGSKVSLAIDWAHRFDNMQRHLGEHILSGAVYRLYGGTNRGFHMGDDYMTIDIRFENEDGSATDQVFTEEMMAAAEAEANRVIWLDLPVSVDYFTDAAEAAAMPLRKALTLEEDISVVTVGDVADPMDCCACCGTHPATSGQVGLVKTYKVEKNKDMFRIYFDAGRRAMAHYDRIADVIAELSGIYSAPLEEPEKILKAQAIEKEKAGEVHKVLSDLRKAHVQRICDAAISEAHQDLQSWGTVPTTLTPRGIRVADFDSAAKIMQDRLIGTCFIRFVEDATVLMYSDGDFDCGQAVKDYASRYQGKGGGSATYARAMFPDREQMDAFLAQFGCRQDLMI